jgi:hypothetical protein
VDTYRCAHNGQHPYLLSIRPDGHEMTLTKGKSSIRLVLDNHTAAKAVLDQQRADYTETEVAHVNLAHRPGELGRAASRLGDAGININYGYCGAEPATNSPILIFGVADAGKAAKVLEPAAGSAI